MLQFNTTVGRGVFYLAAYLSKDTNRVPHVPYGPLRAEFYGSDASWPILDVVVPLRRQMVPTAVFAELFYIPGVVNGELCFLMVFSY